METIGNSELGERTGEIMRRVREEGAAFEITYRGRVVGRLVPVQELETAEPGPTFWEQWDNLAREIGARTNNRTNGGRSAEGSSRR